MFLCSGKKISFRFWEHVFKATYENSTSGVKAQVSTPGDKGVVSSQGVGAWSAVMEEGLRSDGAS